MAAVVLGVTSVTLAVGLGKSLTTYQTAASRVGRGRPDDVRRCRTGRSSRPRVRRRHRCAKLSDAADEALLRSTPGASSVTASADLDMRLAGTKTDLRVSFYRGDFEQLGYRILDGRWFDGPGQVVVSERFLRQRGLAVGDTITLQAQGKSVQAQIVGKALYNSGDEVLSNWQTLGAGGPDHAGQRSTRSTSSRAPIWTPTSRPCRRGDSGLQEAAGQDAGSVRRDRPGDRRTADSDAGDRGCARCLQHRRPQHPRAAP